MPQVRPTQSPQYLIGSSKKLRGDEVAWRAGGHKRAGVPRKWGQLDPLTKEQVCLLLPESYDSWVTNCGPDCSQERDLSASARSSTEGFSVSLEHVPPFQEPGQQSLMRPLEMTAYEGGWGRGTMLRSPGWVGVPFISEGGFLLV